MTLKYMWLAILMLLFAAGVPVQAQLKTQALEVTGGKITGIQQGGLSIYKGIPYAAPPVGDLRWKAPQPVKPWAGVRNCTKFGNIAVQPVLSGRKAKPGNQSEDCLYLNIWTSAKPGEKRPVMVWIHGGAMTVGSSTQPAYDGQHLAREGVVLVSINYRLGVLGFMPHPELSKESALGVSGNYGLLDQIAALQWVKANIVKFGGDPDNVTIFGESAGALSVGCLLISPMAKGLFHRAILQSGTGVGIRTKLSDRSTQSVSEAQGLSIEKELAPGQGIAGLRKVPLETLIKNLKLSIGPTATKAGTYKFGPVIDGKVIPDYPFKLMQEGRFHRVPIMIGANRDEMTMFTRGKKIKRKQGYDWVLKQLHKDAGTRQKIQAVYPVKEGDDYTDKLVRLMGFARFVAPARMLAKTSAQHGNPVWYYHFERIPPIGKKTGLGAKHGIEISYIFNSSDMIVSTDLDKDLSKRIQAAWIAFATSGDPNHPGIPQWTPYNSDQDLCLFFGDKIQLKVSPLAKLCDIFHDEYEMKAKKFK